MKHPTLANWIRFKSLSEDEYEIIDMLQDERRITDSYTVWFARQLNGKRNPYEIDKTKSREEVDSLLEELEKENIIRDKRFYSKLFLLLMVTVWRPRVTDGKRIAAFFINGFLLISWLPFLAFSVYYFLEYTNDLNMDYITFGCISGMLVGIIMHELGHMVACLAYGGQVFEVGVLLQFFMPGAYVLMNEGNIKKRMRRIQVSAAGIEMNFLLTAVFLILTASFETLSGFFLGAAIQNLFLAFLNLTFVNSFDGMRIMSELLGVEGLVDKAKKITKSNLCKRKLRKAGISGKAIVGACYALRAVQVALPLILALNIVGVVSWFL